MRINQLAFSSYGQPSSQQNGKEARNKTMRLAMPTARLRLRHAGSKDHKDQIVDGSTKGIKSEKD